jgi:aerobic carbon-monoxide dehydrogenase medium subunit
MIPRVFDYFDPRSTEECIDLLAKYGDDAKLLAGGQSLLPMMKLRLSSPKVIIDMWRIPGLSYIRKENGVIAIGAMTTHRSVQDSDLIKRTLPILEQAANVVGDPLVRNLGTIGGSAAHAAPNADYPTVLVALGAEFGVVSPRGMRTIESKEFFKDVFTTSLQADEMLTEVRIRVPRATSSGRYLKLSRRGTDFAIVSVGVMVNRTEDGTCESAEIVLGGVGNVPVQATKSQDRLRGQRLTKELIEQAGEVAVEGLDPPSDVQADSQYRLDVSKVYVKRALWAVWDKTN